MEMLLLIVLGLIVVGWLFGGSGRSSSSRINQPPLFSGGDNCRLCGKVQSRFREDDGKLFCYNCGGEQ